MCLQSPSGDYVVYTPMQAGGLNSGLQLLTDDPIITDGKLVAVAKQNGQLKWLELSRDLELQETDI